LIIPLISAGNYGAGIYGSGVYGIGETTTDDDGGSGSGSSGGGGGGGGVSGCDEGYESVDGECVEIEVEENVTGTIPSQLFDITFNLEDTLIPSTDELSVVITFESFGNVPIPVNLTLIILDEDGNEVYREELNITVITEEVLRWDYEKLELDEGKYVAILQTLYGDDVYDEFRQSFEIGARRTTITGNVVGWIGGSGKWWLIGFAVLVVGAGLVWLFIRKRKVRRVKRGSK
jgi:hypothetical protein